MKNYRQEGTVVPMTVPVGGVVSGVPVVVGDVVVIPMATVAYDASRVQKFQALLGGAVDLAKATGTAIAEGAAVYWDATNKVATTTVGSNKKIGAAIDGGATAAATTVPVRFYFQNA
ncbi:putative RecA/RadA family phage recombinase [Agrobacterium vitis]|nr:putative RecA/RadA family phage recombinase [Agrobacterium vitis]